MFTGSMVYEVHNQIKFTFPYESNPYRDSRSSVGIKLNKSYLRSQEIARR